MKSRIHIILSIVFVIFILSIPLSSAERYKQIEVVLDYDNANRDADEQINIADPNSERYSNYNLTWQHFTSPHKDQLVSDWSFDEETNDTAHDSVGNNDGVYPDYADLTVTGHDGTGNGAVQFGIHSPIVVNDLDFTNNTKITVSFWFKQPSSGGLANRYFRVVDGGTEYFSFTYIPYSGEISIFLRMDDGTTSSLTAVKSLSVGNWHFLLGTINVNKGAEIYVNGNEEASTSSGFNSEFDLHGKELNIGDNSDTDFLDDMRLYSAYFENEEVVQNLEGNPKGSVSCAMMPPSTVKTDNLTDGSTQSVVQFTSFSHREIMEGSSIHWWRAPFERVGDDIKIKLTIYETSSLRQANVTYGAQDSGGWYELTPNWVADPRKIYEQSYDIDGDDNNSKIDSINWRPPPIFTTEEEEELETGTIPEWLLEVFEEEGEPISESSEVYASGQDFYIEYNGERSYEVEDAGNTLKVRHRNYSWNFTYVKAFAPIYSGSDYMVVWQWQDDFGDTPAYLYVTQSDVGNNEYYHSIWNIDGTKYYPPIDTLTDVLFEYGLSSKVAGVTTTDTGTTDPSIEFNTTVDIENNNNEVGLDLNDDGYVYLRDGEPLNVTNFSVSFSFKQPTVSSSEIMLTWSNMSDTSYIRIRMSNTGLLHFNVYSGGLSDEIRTTISYDDNYWHNVVFTRSGSGASNLGMIIDGAVEPTTTVVDSGVDTLWGLEELTVGSNEVFGDGMNGVIDDVRIYYDRVITEEEADKIKYGFSITRFNLIYWFPFDSDGDVGDTAYDGDEVYNAVYESLPQGVINSSSNNTQWASGVTHESYIDQDIFTFTFPFTSPTSVDIDVKITLYNQNYVGYPVTFSFSTNDFILISECANVWFGKGNSSTYANIEIDINRSMGVWLMDNHEYGQNYSRTISNIFLNSTQEIRTIGFIPYHTVETMEDTLKNEQPSTFGLRLPALQPKKEKRENQQTFLEIAGEFLYVNVWRPIVRTLKKAVDLAKDALAGVGHYVWDKLSDFGEWALNGLKSISSKLLEAVEWLVNASVWLLMSMLRIMMSMFTFLLFIGTLILTFKFTNYWIMVGTRSWKEANDYLVQNVQEGVAGAQALTMAVASSGASMAGKIKSGVTTTKKGVKKIKSKYKEWRGN